MSTCSFTNNPTATIVYFNAYQSQAHILSTPHATQVGISLTISSHSPGVQGHDRLLEASEERLRDARGCPRHFS